MCHRWKRPFLCHGVFKSSTIHFSGKMGKQRAISPITSLLPRLPRRNSVRRDSLGWWFCLSIHWFECQFVSRAAPKIRCKLNFFKKRLEMGAADYPCDCHLRAHVCGIKWCCPWDWPCVNGGPFSWTFCSSSSVCDFQGQGRNTLHCSAF